MTCLHEELEIHRLEIHSYPVTRAEGDVYYVDVGRAEYVKGMGTDTLICSICGDVVNRPIESVEDEL